MTDKRRKRRESHNAVERRRRDNINDRIAELASLLPDAFQVGAPPPPLASAGRGSGGDEFQTGGGGGVGANAPGSPAIGSLSLMSPGPTGAAFGSGSPTSLHSVSGAAYMAAAAAAAGGGGGSTAQKATTGLSAQAQAAAQKPNKGAVLAKSVDYIRSVTSLFAFVREEGKPFSTRGLTSMLFSWVCVRSGTCNRLSSCNNSKRPSCNARTPSSAAQSSLPPRLPLRIRITFRRNRRASRRTSTRRARRPRRACRGRRLRPSAWAVEAERGRSSSVCRLLRA